MVVLTESSILTRARVPDLANVLKLNVWGCALTDVSLVARCSNLQVFSASCNELTTLKDLESCGNLQELYVRENKITDITDIFSLTALPKLKILWLAGNPCCDVFGENTDKYRLFILKHLPGLERLDNSEVTDEERAKARYASGDLPEYQPRKSKSPSDSGDKTESEHREFAQPETSPNSNPEFGGSSSHHPPNLTSPPHWHMMASPNLEFNEPSSRSGVSVSKAESESKMNGKKSSGKKGQVVLPVAASVPVRLRNANILNAALSLVKELDGESLEILQLDIHNRISSLRGDLED